MAFDDRNVPHASQELQKELGEAAREDSSSTGERNEDTILKAWCTEIEGFKVSSPATGGITVPEEFQMRDGVDIQYFGEIKQRADRLVRDLGEDDSIRDLWMLPSEGLLGVQHTQMVQDIYTEICAVAEQILDQSSLDRPRLCRLVLLMLLWKSSIVESRGSKFIAGVTIRYLEYVLRDKKVHEITTEMWYRAWSVLVTVKNTNDEYFNRGARHEDMEKLITESLNSLLQNQIFGDKIKELMNEDVYRYRNPLWGDPVFAKRSSSEALFLFLKLPGDLFTALEGGRFAITEQQRTGRDEWKSNMREKSRTVIRQYAIDQDGRYYRKFGWRSVIVYCGTLGALIFAGVITALDLGDEGSNVFKRINFFATLAVSIDLLVLGLFKVFDRNDKAITDGLYFKRRVQEIDKEFSRNQYETWRMAIAFDASQVADAVSSFNTCYASEEMSGDIVSPEKMKFDEVKEMFYMMEHGYHAGNSKMVNINTGRQYTVVNASRSSSHIVPAPSYGLAYTGMVRVIRESDNIDNLG